MKQQSVGRLPRSAAFLVSRQHWERIEVKTSAYVQSWDQKGDTSLRFSIRPTKAWSDESGRANERLRHCDMYIFCVLAEKCRDAVDPLVLDQWEFYPVLTKDIDRMLQNQQTAALGTLVRLCPEPFDFCSLRDAVIWLFSNRQNVEARERIDSHLALKRTNITG